LAYIDDQDTYSIVAMPL